MQIEESDKHFRNAALSRQKSVEPGSNMTDKRDADSEKHRSDIFSTEEGMQMDESDGQVKKGRMPVYNILGPNGIGEQQ
jgi:hypothetical protein